MGGIVCEINNKRDYNNQNIQVLSIQTFVALTVNFQVGLVAVNKDGSKVRYVQNLRTVPRTLNRIVQRTVLQFNF